MTVIMFSLDIVRKNMYPQDFLFTQENINEIVNSYMSESGPITLWFDKASLEEAILNIVSERQDPDINNLKSLDLSFDEWVNFY
jgi:hypothetical protein